MTELKPSEYIRQGMRTVKEVTNVFVGYDDEYLPCGCAIGTGVIAKYGSPEKAFQEELKLCVDPSLSEGGPAARCGKLIGLPSDLAVEVSTAHHRHGLSRAFLADCLELKGY